MNPNKIEEEQQDDAFDMFDDLADEDEIVEETEKIQEENAIEDQNTQKGLASSNTK
jgi:hypothetical protein